MQRRLACALVLSGFAALVYETAWARLLRLALGGTSAAHAIVLAAFMGGLALGALLGGRFADRRAAAAALRAFGLCELAVAGLALATAPLLAALPEGLAGSARAVRLGAAFALVLPPTLFMGATLPLVSRACVGFGDGRAHAVGLLYAVNTAGAVLGALATGFWLLPWLGVRGSILAAALANGAAAWLALRARAPAPVAANRAPAPLTAAPGRRLVLAAAALSGAAALGLEVLWTRTLVLVVGSSTHAFALMLATFLGGIAAGSALFARSGARVAGHARLAGLLQLAIAASSVLLLHAANALPYWYVAAWREAPSSGAALLALRLAPAVLLMALPAVLMGASLPALARALAPGDLTEGGTGSDVGAVYAANTAGSLAGAPLAALVLLPGLGFARATLPLAGASLAAGACALLASRGTAAPAGAGSALAVALAAGIAWLTPPWSPHVMGKGLAYVAPKASAYETTAELARANESARVVYYHDGAESTVLVYDGGEGTQRSFVVNGRHEATSAPADARNQYLLGHLPALLHRGPVKEGLVIALGSGMTAGCLALHAERVTVVELEPHVVQAARTFADWNHGAIGHPKIDVVIDDGRSFLSSTERSFDVITVDPIHPSVRGSDALYSLEQYRLVKRRLAPGGIAAQWLPLYEMGVEDARAITRTFHAAFEDAQVWVNGPDAILIGGAGAAPVAAAHVRDGLARPEILASLARVRQGKLGTLLAGFALGASGTARYAAGAPLLTDDRPLLEFTLPARMYDRSVAPNLLEIFRFARKQPAPATDGLGEEETADVARARLAVQADVMGLAFAVAGHDEAMREGFQMALEQNPDDPIALDLLGK